MPVRKLGARRVRKFGVGRARAPLSDRHLIGVSLETVGSGAAATETTLQAHEALLGSAVDLPHYYHLWDTTTPTSQEQARAALGQVPLIAWQTKRNAGTTPTWAGIAAGAEDTWIDAQAARFAAAPGEYIINFENEPELQATIDMHGTLTEYRDAFKRIVTRFRNAGATNVYFAFVVMGIMTDNKKTQVLSAYPGDAYIDYVGYDPYNWFDTPDRNVAWLTWDQMVEPWYTWATTNLTNSRPYMLAEYGSVVDPADALRRRDWFNQAATAIENHTYPLLRALVYFDHPRPPATGEWTLGTGADFAAYKDMTRRVRAMPLYNPTVPLRQKPVSGAYAHIGGTGTGTSNTLGAGSLRLSPWPVYDITTLAKIGAEITAAGTAGSLLRLVIYGDNGNGYPGDLILDAGTIDGATVARAEITTTQVLVPGLYWVGGVLQGTLTSQPTVRTVNPPMPFLGMTVAGTSLPGANDSVAGYTDASATTTLPTTFTATRTIAGSAPRIFVKFA